jgi:hypothetical protein
LFAFSVLPVLFFLAVYEEQTNSCHDYGANLSAVIKKDYVLACPTRVFVIGNVVDERVIELTAYRVKQIDAKAQSPTHNVSYEY